MKNKSKNINITWPTKGHFTIEDLQTQHPDIINITLRFRIKKALEAGELTAIGKLKPAIGRPKLVMTFGKPTEATLENAKKAGVVLDNQTDTTVAVSVANVAPATVAVENTVAVEEKQTVSV
jgi:hypothetical protein